MESSHRARKRFGQNFLHDPGIIQRIIRAIGANDASHLVEIGPGQGAITEGLLATGAQLDAVELDRDLIPLLKSRFQQANNFNVHEADALRFDFRQLLNEDSDKQADKKLKIVGNLPYNISTPLIFHLLDQYDIIDDMHFMLQLEVVNRLAAQPGSKTYGRLSVMAQYYCDIRALFEVPPEAFQPQPKVTSAIVQMTPHRQLPHPANSTATLQAVLRNSFNQRRKTLRNSLKDLIDSEQLAAIDIDPQIRPERLCLEQFVRISNHIDSLTNSHHSE